MARSSSKEAGGTINVRENFGAFVALVWKHLGLPLPTGVQFDIAMYLQHGPRRKIIEAFRGVGKSWITSAFVLWCLLRNPEEKFLVVSASKARSDDFSTFCHRLITEMPILQHLAPKQTSSHRESVRSSKLAWDVAPAKPSHAPSVKSVGIFGQLTGSRATHIVADDVEVAQNSSTQDAREKLLRAVGEFEAIIVPGGYITFLGTPQTEESIYNVLPEHRGYEKQIWPALYPEKDKIPVYGPYLSPKIVEKMTQAEEVQGHSIVGQPTDPKRFGLEDLMERKGSYGNSGFALQFMLDTSLSDAERYPLKLRDLIISPVNTFKAPIRIQHGSTRKLEYPNPGFTGDYWCGPLYIDDIWEDYEGSVMAIDPSGRGKDETGYAVVKQLHGTLYVLEVGGISGGYEDNTLTKLAEVARNHEVNLILVESNFGDGMFSRLFQTVLVPIHNARIEEVRSSTQKEKRIIDTLEPIMNQHRLVMNTEVVEADIREMRATDNTRRDYSLFYQMTRLTRDRGSLKHDDRLDALSMAVNYWVESMSRDQDDAVKHHHEALLNKELEEFIKYCTHAGGTPRKKGTRWVSVRERYR